MLPPLDVLLPLFSAGGWAAFDLAFRLSFVCCNCAANELMSIAPCPWRPIGGGGGGGGGAPPLGAGGAAGGCGTAAPFVAKPAIQRINPIIITLQISTRCRTNLSAISSTVDARKS